MGVGSFIGNVIGLILIVVAALFGFVSLESSAIALIAISYTAWLFVTVSNLFSRPSRDVGLGTLLSDAEFEVYRRYHTYLWFPGGGEMFSSALNLCRLAGFVWAGLCIWQGHYWLAAALVAFFFVSGSIILKTNPALYVGRPASQGNAFAMEQMALLEAVKTKREIYNSEPDEDPTPAEIPPDKPDATDLTPIDLFNLTIRSAAEFHTAMAATIPTLPKTGDFKTDVMPKLVAKLMERPSIGYCYGLTLVCMLKRDMHFLQSPLADDYSQLVLRRMADLCKTDIRNMKVEGYDDAKAMSDATEEMKKIVVGAIEFSKQIVAHEKEPLWALNAYFGKLSGMTKPKHTDQLTKTGKELLRKINAELPAA